MGLAPYGEPKYVQLIYDHLLDLRADGSFRLNQEYFGYLHGLKMTTAKFDRLFGGPSRVPGRRSDRRRGPRARCRKPA
jgi:carbamoyltransferase